jgi:hypothetical protein
MSNIWNNLDKLDTNNRNIVNNYFNNVNGKYIIKDDILTVDFENWGKENFYLHGLIRNSNLYKVEYEYKNKIYDIAISIQIGNWEVFKKMEVYLENFNKINVNIYFVMINSIATYQNITYLQNKYKISVILSAENRGMDIGLFLLSLYYIKINKLNHDYIIKIHTKTNDNFRNETLNNIMGSEDRIIQNFRKLSQDRIGIISGNIIYRHSEYKDAFSANYYHLENLIKYLYNENIQLENL